MTVGGSLEPVVANLAEACAISVDLGAVVLIGFDASSLGVLSVARRAGEADLARVAAGLALSWATGAHLQGLGHRLVGREIGIGTLGAADFAIANEAVGAAAGAFGSVPVVFRVADVAGAGPVLALVALAICALQAVVYTEIVVGLASSADGLGFVAA